jgi:hypothetical protein
MGVGVDLIRGRVIGWRRRMSGDWNDLGRVLQKWVCAIKFVYTYDGLEGLWGPSMAFGMDVMDG